MKLFKKKEPQIVEVKGHSLVCPICSNNTFYIKNAFVVRLMRRNWSRCFICSECTYTHWFWG